MPAAGSFTAPVVSVVIDPELMVPEASTSTMLVDGTAGNAAVETARLSAEIPDPPALIVPALMLM